MNFLVILPLVSCMLYCVLATTTLVRDSSHPTSRLGAAICAAGAWWAGCEALWTTATDASVVMMLVKLSSIGWLSIGALTLHLFLHVSERPERYATRHPLMPAVYGVVAVSIGLSFATPLLHESVEQTSWGWGYHTGPLFPLAYALVALPLIGGFVLVLRDLSPVERASRHTRLLCAGIAIAFAVPTWTDVWMPMSGQMAPRLGTASIAILLTAVAVGFDRRGYSLLSPGAFAWGIFQALPDGIALLRLDGRVRVANPMLEQMLGAAPRSLEGESIGDVLGAVEIVPQEELHECETVLHPKGVNEDVVVAISTTQLCDKMGEPTGLVLIARDLREVAALRSRLVVADRLAAVGQLAAGIAHEVNNPMAYVRSNLSALVELLDFVDSKLPAEARAQLRAEIDDGRDLLAESVDGVDRVTSIVRDVKDFSHAGTTDRDLVDLRLVVEAALRVSAAQRPDGCEVETCFRDVPMVEGSAQELRQVFLNLALNAFQASEGPGIVRVSTLSEGDHAVVLIEDQGVGMSPETQERIFDPFFTTKPVGKGTGLGLSISYQIVKNHGGSIDVVSEPDHGTTFRVTLPASREDDQAEAGFSL